METLSPTSAALNVPCDTLEVKLLDDRAQAPEKVRPGDAGHDLRSIESFILEPNERRLVKTGIALAIPPGVAGLVTPRSGLAAKHGIGILNSPGLIDPNYRGECCVILYNAGSKPFAVNEGDRIAQLLLVSYHTPTFNIVDVLPETLDRGAQGFGSSGV